MTPTADNGASGRPVTLDDVARRAGVSQPTASRVLNGSERRVKESFRERVLQAAAELGYTTNIAAQTVARGASHTVALVISGISDPYFSAMAAAVMREAEAAGLRVTISVTERHADRELELVRELRGQRPRAIILAGTGYVEPELNDALTEELKRYEASGGRVVLISRTELPFETVLYDNREGARMLAAELAASGYRRVLAIGSGLPLLAMRQRVDGFVAGLAEKGVALPPERILSPEFSWEGCRDAIAALSDEELDATELIFAVTDELALGAMAGLRARGRRIPEDVAVAGFDDITTLRDVAPALTTVHIPLDLVAAEAVRRATADDPGPARPIPAQPVVRASTPPRPATA